MADNIRITVSHPYGSKFFVLSPSKRKVLGFAVLFSFLSIALGISAIYYLTHRSSTAEMTVKSLAEKKTELTNQLEELALQRQSLIEQRQQLIEDIDDIQLDHAEIIAAKQDEYEQIIEAKESAHAQVIEEKDTELTYLSQRVSSVEVVLGLDKELSDIEELSSRIEAAAMNSAVRATMLKLIPSGKPIKKFRYSSGFGSRKHPVTGKKKFHLGLDLTANIGTPIYAPADGVVEYKRNNRKTGYGNVLKVGHAFGFMTLYAHLEKFNVKLGQFVRKGDLIAWTGNTGLSTGPHLHYEVRFVGRALNPSFFMSWTPESFESLLHKEKRVDWANLISIIEGMVATNIQVASSTPPEQSPMLANRKPARQEEKE
ncbi:M23 family metallopeptidase [Veronia pacifica]|uniref:Peptidase M23 n=1 Tax=Veronia pacifica TaxID=1080227 RepID=A0A1C3EK74_9GAMM|nr:M23 family metallopeptidase [Veronia pacifica]ODA33623.1 peptidase M23 [Veronia pacifica]